MLVRQPMPLMWSVRDGLTGARAALRWLAAARSHRVLCLVLGVWVLNIFDFILTITAHRQHLLHELNPLAKSLLTHGEPFLGLFKFGLLAIGTYALVKYRRERISELGCFVVLGSYVLVALQWHYCYEMYAMTVDCGPDVAHLWQPSRAALGAWNTQPLFTGAAQP